MAQATNKTQATKLSVQDFLAGITDARQRADAKQLCDLMEQVTGRPPVMWGSSIVGFGQYHYIYDSGREGDMAAAGFSPRKANLTIYLPDGVSPYEVLLNRLGPHKTSKACLYIKHLNDVDLDALRQILKASYQYVLSRQDNMHRVPTMPK